MELTSEVASQIERLCEDGDSLLDEGDAAGAMQKYRAAEALVPEPKTGHAEAMWVYAAIGDTYFFKQDYHAAIITLNQARVSPEGQGNAFVHMRLGQAQWEMGNLDLAADHLRHAQLAAGDEIFDDEEPKYLEFLRSRVENE